MAAKSGTETEVVGLEEFTCSICMDVFDDPVTVPCGSSHTFCKGCIDPILNTLPAICTLCRAEFKANKVKKDKKLQKLMNSSKCVCVGCQNMVPLCDMRAHQTVCDKIDRRIKYFEPVKETTQRIPSDLPNRSTFQCPYCEEKNFESSALVKHCNEKHQYETKPVVCPICSSMPWGDSTQTSQNFHQHLNHRHRFEYDTFVDYQQDDDAMLKAAIEASLAQT